MQRTSLPVLSATALAVALCLPIAASAQAGLGNTQSFAVLAATTATNTGISTITGNLGVSPGTAATGFLPGAVTGSTHLNDTVAGLAQADAATAYAALLAAPCSANLTGQDLGGLVLLPGVYCLTGPAQLTGALVLNAAGQSSAVFVFQCASTLTTAAGSSVTVINGGSACNVFWQVGTSATLGASSVFAGNLLASASLTATTGASVSGRLIALTGAVTLDAAAVAIPLECQCNGPTAIAANLGPSCDPLLDPLLGATPPVYGLPFTLGVQSTPNPFALTVLFASVAPVSPILIEGTNCVSYLDYHDMASFFLVTVTALDATGVWTATVQLPLAPALAGIGFVMQAVVYTPGVSSAQNAQIPYLFSNGLLLQIGCN